MRMVIIRSKPFNILLAKVWAPVWCIGVSLLLVTAKNFPSWNLLAASPFLVAAWFGASLAIVELRGDVLRYRRLFKWTIIPEDDIVSAGVACSPIIGSMRLKRFMFPWGRLYFLLDADFRQGEYALLRYIRKQPFLEDLNAARSNSQNNPPKVKLVGAAVAGALASLLQLTFSRPVPEFERSPNAVIEIVWQIRALLGKFEVICILSVVFTIIAVYRYRRRDAWIYAFLAGTSLPLILLHWL